MIYVIFDLSSYLSLPFCSSNLSLSLSARALPAPSGDAGFASGLGETMPSNKCRHVPLGLSLSTLFTGRECMLTPLPFLPVLSPLKPAGVVRHHLAAAVAIYICNLCFPTPAFEALGVHAVPLRTVSVLGVSPPLQTSGAKGGSRSRIRWEPRQMPSPLM